MSSAPPLSPAAQRVRALLDDPPRAGWTRRSFLQTLSAAAALPWLASTDTLAEAQQRAGGRVRITDVKIQRLRVEKDWGTYEDYIGARRGGRTGGGAIVELYTDQGLVGIGPGISPAALEPIKGYLAGKDPFDVNRHVAMLYGGGREGGLRIPGGRPTGVEIALWDLIGKAANQPRDARAGRTSSSRPTGTKRASTRRSPERVACPGRSSARSTPRRSSSASTCTSSKSRCRGTTSSASRS